MSNLIAFDELLVCAFIIPVQYHAAGIRYACFEETVAVAILAKKVVCLGKISTGCVDFSPLKIYSSKANIQNANSPLVAQFGF